MDALKSKSSADECITAEKNYFFQAKKAYRKFVILLKQKNIIAI
jgi:hypothetical protein